jgi:hypothetical protein
MPRYFFNINDRQDVTRDEEGIDLPNLDAVREEAIASARQIMSQGVLDGTLPDGRKFIVTDEAGSVVLEFGFKDAMRTD